MKPKSRRDKFATRKFLLGADKVRDQVMAVVRNLPIDPLRPLEVVVQEEPRKRGLDANAYYWLRLGEAAEQCWLEGRSYNADTWHEYLKRNVMADEIVTKDGERRPKWIEMPDGALTVISTTQLEKACFFEYTTMCEAFFANLGVRFSADPRQVGHE